MYRTIRRLVPATLAAGTLLLAACSDDSSTSGTTAGAAGSTALAVDTTTATEPEVTIAEPDDTVETSTGVVYQDPAELLAPLAGHTFLPAPDGVGDALVQEMNADPVLASQVLAVGAVMTQNDTTGDQVLLIFFELKEPLGDADLAEYYDSVTAGGTDIIDVDVAGRSGKAFVSGSTSSFTTVSGTTGILAQADSTDALQASVTALFEANPQL